MALLFGACLNNLKNNSMKGVIIINQFYVADEIAIIKMIITGQDHLPDYMEHPNHAMMPIPVSIADSSILKVGV